MRTLRILLALLAALPAASPLAAQRVQLEGRGPIETDSVLRRIIGSGQYRLITADTIIPAADTLRGPILIAATTIKFENVIVGDVAIVDANVFLRPHAHITGNVVNIAGGLFRAASARIDGEVREWKMAPYRAERRGSDVRIVSTQLAALFDLDGFAGFHAPTYDRVSGLSVTFGARYLLPRLGSVEPELGARVGYQTAREKLHGGAEAAVRAGSFRFAAGAESRVFTHDAWARGWTNTPSYLVTGHDSRDYYSADRYHAGPAIDLAGWSIRLEAQIEDAHSLPSRDAWHAFGEPARSNPPIDDGRITSLVMSGAHEWIGGSLVTSTVAAIETGHTWLRGRHEFARFDAGGHWAMRAFANHTFLLRARFRGPLPGTDSLPRQRWNALAPRATLPTLDDAGLRGDRLAYIHSAYTVPLPVSLALPILGRPAVEVSHRIGNAWSAGQQPDLIQNLGAALRFRIAFLEAVIDPADGEGARILFGLSLTPRYPWTPID